MSSNSANVKTNTNSSNGNNNKLFGIILICIAILVIIYFIYSMIKGYGDYRKYSPYLLSGIVDGTQSQKIKAYKINPPMDNQYGTELSYSFWIFINDTNFGQSSGCTDADDLSGFKHIFHKGSYDYSKTNKHFPLLQMPGVWLYPKTNKLNIRFNTYENIVESADVGNIPLNAWVHLSIVLIGNSVDVFVNGNLKKRQKLRGVPKLNYEDFYIGNWGGFLGYLCRLRYFNYAIQPFMVEYLFKEGPASEFDSTYSSGITNPSPHLSPNYWMTVGFPNTIGAPAYNADPGQSSGASST